MHVASTLFACDSSVAWLWDVIAHVKRYHYVQAICEGVEAAADNLRRKSISLARSHYGSLSYILAYATSGHKCELYLMSTDGEVRASGLTCLFGFKLRK